MSLPQRRISSTPARLKLLVAIAVAALVGPLIAATPAAAAPLPEGVLASDTATWPAAPYSPLTWAEVPSIGNNANLTFDGEAGGLPDAAGVGTGFSMIQPSSYTGSAPYYEPANLSVAGGKLTIAATPGIAFLKNVPPAVPTNTQDNTLGFGVDAAGKALVLSTTLDSPASANSSAQGGLWFGPNDDNFIKISLIGSTSTTARQIQLSKEINGLNVAPTGTATTSVDQSVVNTTQSVLGAGPVTLNLLVDGVSKRVAASYQIGSAAPVALNTAPLTALPENFFDGTLLTVPAESDVTSFGGLFSTRRNLTSAISYSFENFGMAEADVTPPAAPAAVTANGALSSVGLTWAPVDDAAGYRVYRSSTSPVALTGTPLSGAAPVTGTTFVDDQTFGGTGYHYAVVAVDAAGNVSVPGTAGPAGSAPTPGDVVAKYDFTTATGNLVSGYTRDSGEPFDQTRGFGWTNPEGVPTSYAAATRVRANAVDPRLQSIIHLQIENPTPIAPFAQWKTDVPNGTYTIVAAVGDTNVSPTNGYDSTHTVNAEGVKVIDRFQANVAREFDEATLAGVVVSDGVLNIDAIGGRNSKLAYLEIYRTALVTPAVPADVTAAIDGSDIGLTWTASANAESYKVFRSTSPEVDTTGTPLATVDEPAFTDETSQKGTTYYYAVIATSDQGIDSAASAPVAVELAFIEPAVPTGLAFTLAGTDVSLSWAAAENAVSYDVYRGTTPGVDTTGESLATVTVSAYSDLATEADTTYYYAVTATSLDERTSAPSSVLEVVVPEIDDPTPPVTCPTSWKAEFFEGASLAGAPVSVVCVSAIDQNFDGGLTPAGIDGPNEYSVRWTRTIDDGAGSYEIATRTDDGVRVRIDGQFVVNRWFAQAADTTYVQQASLGAGAHTVVVEYYQGFGDASARVTVKKVIGACPSGAWLAEYFDNTSLNGQVAFRECVDDIDQEFAAGDGPDDVGPNLYSIRWTKTIDEGKGTYLFSARTDDGVRVRVDGNLVIDEWYDQDATETHEAEAPLSAGPHIVTVDYYQGYNTASAEVGYEKTFSDTIAPDAPTGVATTSSDAAITVSWNASAATDTIGYQVYRGTTPDVVTSGLPLHGVMLVDGLQFVDTTAVDETQYYYLVVAADDSANRSAPSAPAAGLISLVPDTEAPSAPTALTATTANASVALSWTASASTDTAGYRVYRGTEPAVAISGTPVSGTAPIAGSTFVDSTVTNGTTYFYVIVAVDQAGNVSPGSNEIVAVPLVPNTTNVKVDFTATNAAPVTGYYADWGQSYGARTGTTQGAGALTYGWATQDGLQLSLVGNGRDRGRPGVPDLVDSMIHLQYGDVDGGAGANGVKTEGLWELAVPNGLYSVKLAVGDEMGATTYDSTHVINVEGTVGIEKFTGTPAAEYSTVTTTVGVWDGKLTIDPTDGMNTKLGYVEVTGLPFTTHVDTVLPENRVTGHDVNAGVSATIKLPYAGIGLNPATLPGNVKLFEVATGIEVPSTVGSSGGNDVISLAPNDPMKPLTAYRFVVGSGVKDNLGGSFTPFTSLFTTGTGEVTESDEFTPITGVAFEKVELPTGRGKYWASFAFGPDGKLYGTTIGQGIWRFPVNANGTLGEPEALGYEGVAHIGLLFDKTSTASDLRVWVTRTTANFSEQGQWVSSIHQLSGPDLGTDRTIFEGLPRSLSDHLTNSMAYGPDGRIYVQQGSNQASGDLDSAWGQRGEQLLTAATLVFDPANPQVATAAAGGTDINVQTAGPQDAGETAYDPYASSAPLKLYATGIRNAYDMVWHSNNHLYIATNGTAGGANTPGVTANANGTFTRTAAPGIPGFSTVNGRDVTPQCVRRGYTGGTVPPTGNIPTQKDLLFDVVQGGYYGHPNPERCEWVLNAGNNPATPTAPGTAQTRYPSGVLADSNYRGVAYDFEFNKSPNGAIEYKSSTFGGQLKGRLVITRFSNNNDLQFTQVDQATGKVLGAQFSVGITGVPNSTIGGVDGFNDPLEVVEDPSNGNLYVNQYDRSGGDQRMYLLRVPASQQASGITSSANELVFSGVRGTMSGAKTITVTNNGQSAATVNTALVGNQTGDFAVTGGNVSVPAGGTITLNVRFQPNSAASTVGQRSTTLRLTSGTSTVDVGLYGLSMLGIEGGNEPTLNNVLGTLGYSVNVGWTTLAGGVQQIAKGDEVLEPLFVKSGTALPTMVPLAQYAPRENLPFGWYTGDGVGADRRTLGSIDTSGYQSLLPPSSPGTATTFDPGAASFGLFYVSNVFQRTGFTEDRLNTGTPHRARIYPAKNRSGSILPNSYLISFEDADNGDYQDYVFLVTGVKPVTDTGSVDGGVRVDFTSKAGRLAAGYLRDYGQAYALRADADQGTGLTFGWKDDTTENDVDISVGGTPAPGLGNGRDRATSQTDQRLQSLMHMQGTDVPTFNGNKVDALWELALPSGQYTVTVAVGDAQVNQDTEIHQINLEDTAAITLFTPTGLAGSASRHQTVTKVVSVTDGALTVDARGGTNTKINYVDVVPVENPGEGDDPTDGAQVKVNFQPAGAPTPTGWTADTGVAFSTAAGSGWLTPAGAPLDWTLQNRYRTAAASGIAFSSDPLLQTFAFLEAPNDAIWERVVPNGTYEVAASVGDSSFLDSVHTVTAEGQPVIAAFTPTTATPFQTGKRTVTVTDGRLTIAGNGENTKINWVSIKGDGLEGPGEPTVPAVKVNFQPDTVAAPSGWFADTGSAFAAGRGYGWLVDGSPTDRSNATRNRATPTAGIAFPTGDVTRQTLILTQAGTVDGVADGVWEYVLANGTYNVSVSVGDPGYTDSVHGVQVEGQNVVNAFTPTNGTPFTTGTAQVVVADGRLTMTSNGDNTKVNWITIAGATLAAPSITVRANGAPVDGSYSGGVTTVALEATASTGAEIETLTYSLDGGPATPYTAPLVLDDFGAQQLVVTAVDSEGRTSTRTVAFTIEDIGGNVALRNEQVTRVNGAPIPGFSEDWVVMHRINSGVVLHEFPEQATVTVTNDGAKNLKITDLAIAGPNAAQFELVEPPAEPTVVAPGASLALTVEFIANTGARGIRSAQLNIVSSDLESPTTTVQLRGGYMVAPEGNDELTLNQVSALYGWTTTIGNLVNGDEMRTSPLKGEEVRSLQWKRADASLPVQARQLAAFHGCCGQTENININGASATHAAPYGQSILPVTSAGAPVQISTNPTGNFNITVSGQNTANPNYMALKTWPVRDRNGAIVAGAWIVGHDYISSPNQCGIAPTNCDFQDNVYLVTNALPVASSDITAPAPATGLAASVAESTVSLSWSASSATDLAGYYVERATSAAGPWTRISGGTPVKGLSYSDSSLPFASTVFYRVLAVDASGNVSTPTATAEADISAIAAQTLRINAGGPAVTTPSGAWLADQYFVGGKTYSNGQVTQIGGTTDDAVYLSERSGTGTIGYDIPVPNGSYTVKIHFAEIYHGATGGGAGGTGKRVFSVNFEGGTVEIPGLDLNARVAPMTAFVTTNTVTVNGGVLDIDLVTSVNEAKISAIEVTRNVGVPTPPDAPTGVNATVAGTSVDLGWTASAAATGYSVERADSATGPWTVISGPTPISVTSFTDAGRPTGSTSYYRVIAVGATGLVSDASSTVTGVIPPVAPAAPSGLTATVSGAGVNLGWTASPSAGVTGYFVERSAAASGPFTRISGTVLISGTTYADTTVAAGATVYYRVVAVGQGSLGSTPSNTATATRPFIAPAAPTALSATVSGANVDLGWTASASAGVTGYVVERSATTAGPWSRVSGATPLAGTTFTDTTLEPGQSFSYRVIAVGQGALTSTPSNTATATRPFPVPAAATGLTATVSGVNVNLSWTASTSAGVTGYFVERAAAASGPWTRISGTGLIAGTTYADTTVAAGATVFYRVVATGQGAVNSTPSNTATATRPFVAPAAPSGLAATVAGGNVNLSWTASASAGVTGYFVERASAAAGPFTRISGTGLIAGTTYADTTVAAGATVFYRVVAVGQGSLGSTPSNTVTATRPFVAPAAPSGLTATVAGATVNLGWTASTSAGVTGYFVERATAAPGPWTRISGAGLIAGTTYADTTVAAGTTVFYRVIAVSQGALNSTPSNTATATRPSTPVQQPVRINAGGGAVTVGGVTWAADNSFVGSGKTYSNPQVAQIGGTTSDAIYLNERSSTANLAPFGYDVPVANGAHTVKLHFAELYHGAPGGGAGGTGKRVFSVNFEGGATEVTSLDLNSKVAPTTAWITTNTVTVTDGVLDIDFTATVNQPSVAAIEVIPGMQPAPVAPASPTGVAASVTGATNAVSWAASSSTNTSGYFVERSLSTTGPWTRLSAVPTSALSASDSGAPTSGTVYYRVIAINSEGVLSAPTASVALTRGAALSTVRINTGGGAVTAGGFSWLADQYFSGAGKSFTNTSVTQIAGTTADSLYLSERSATANLGSFSYDVPVPNGSYTVRLHFAEIWHGATGGGAGGTGKRVFGVNFEGGATEIVGLDLNVQVAPMTAYITTNTVSVVGGNLDIDFAASVDQPTIAAIEIVPAAAPGAAGAPAPAAPPAAAAPPATVPPGPATQAAAAPFRGSDLFRAPSILGGGTSTFSAPGALSFDESAFSLAAPRSVPGSDEFAAASSGGFAGESTEASGAPTTGAAASGSVSSLATEPTSAIVDLVTARMWLALLLVAVLLATLRVLRVRRGLSSGVSGFVSPDGRRIAVWS